MTRRPALRAVLSLLGYVLVLAAFSWRTSEPVADPPVALCPNHQGTVALANPWRTPDRQTRPPRVIPITEPECRTDD